MNWTQTGRRTFLAAAAAVLLATSTVADAQAAEKWDMPAGYSAKTSSRRNT